MSAATVQAGLFARVPPYAGDPILTLNEVFGDDPRGDKINLSIGVYLDAVGRLPVMQAVREAELSILHCESPKPYLPMGGAAAYRQAVQALVFGADAAVVRERRVATIQTIGGSGALRIGADFLKTCYPDAGVWVSDPTWDNHRGLIGGCGFAVHDYPYYDADAGTFDAAGMLAKLETLPAFSIVLLHACCHNPTGVDPSRVEWRAIVETLKRRQLIPFVDMAYQGFGQGLDEDAFLPRLLAEQGQAFLLASSFSKNFSLYGERCGALSVVCQDAALADRVFGQLQAAVRRNYSSPPAHGGALVAAVLNDPALRSRWEAELRGMRQRIAAMRAALRSALETRSDRAFSFITSQSGMFSYTGLGPEQVDLLRKRAGIYLLKTGRACLTGLNASNVERVAEAFAAVYLSPDR